MVRARLCCILVAILAALLLVASPWCTSRSCLGSPSRDAKSLPTVGGGRFQHRLRAAAFRDAVSRTGDVAGNVAVDDDGAGGTDITTLPLIADNSTDGDLELLGMKPPDNTTFGEVPVVDPSSYSFLPPGCGACRNPEPPANLPPPREPHPRSSTLLKEFNATGKRPRRVLFVGDSLVRYVFTAMSNRAGKEGVYVANEPHTNLSATGTPGSGASQNSGYPVLDPYQLKVFGHTDFPLPQVALVDETIRTSRLQLRYESEPHISSARQWDASGAVKFRPTHVLLQKGPWDMIQLTPHSPRRSFKKYVDGLVKARRTFPPSVRVMVYGLHKIQEFQRPGEIGCGNKHEQAIYRRMFFCAVRRANAILMGLDTVAADSISQADIEQRINATAATTGLLEYFDSYAWTADTNLHDTYKRDALHFVNDAMERVLDGVLDTFITKPVFPVPLVGKECAMRASFIANDLTPCQPLFFLSTFRHVTVIHLLSMRINATLDRLDQGFPKRFADEVVVINPTSTPPYVAPMLLVEQTLMVERCAALLYEVTYKIGRFRDALALYSPLNDTVKVVIRRCQSYLDKNITKPIAQEVIPQMLKVNRLRCANIMFVSSLQSAISMQAGGTPFVPTNDTHAMCFTEPTNILTAFFFQGNLANNTPEVQCVPFMNTAWNMRRELLVNPLDETTLPMTRNVSAWLAFTGSAVPAVTYRTVLKVCMTRFTRYSKEEFLKMDWGANCNALRSIMSGVGMWLSKARGVDPTETLKQFGCG